MGRRAHRKINPGAGTWKNFESGEGGGWQCPLREPRPVTCLMRRRVGPPDGPALPESVRWIPAQALADVLRRPDASMPEGALGGRSGFPLQRRAPSLEARSTHGQAASDRTKPGPGSRWRRKVGQVEGLRFETPDRRRRLAACVGRRGHSVGPGCPVRAAGGRLRHSDRGSRWLSRFILPRLVRPGAPRIHIDRGLPGPRGESLLRKLRETGRTVEADGLYRLDKSGMDAAYGLAVEVGERASILERDGGLSRDESEQKAWEAAMAEWRQGKLEL